MKSINKISIFLLLGLIIFLSGCTSPKDKFEEDYQMFKNVDHVFEKVNYRSAYNALTGKGKYVIVFAYDPDLYVCPYCMEVLPILNEAALESEVVKILYLDIRTMRVERTDEYTELIDYIFDQVDDLKSREGKLEIIVPDVYVVSDGEILAHHVATLKDDEGKYILGLDDNQKSELKDIYINMFDKLKS